MVLTKAAGTASRCAATCRICRVASQNLTSSVASNAATNKRVRENGLMGRSVGRRCDMPHTRADASAPLGGFPPRGCENGRKEKPRMSETVLAASDQNLVWIDLEMTGLYPDKDRIIEIAVVVTDPQ